MPEAPRLKAPSEFRIIGKPAARRDARAKVDGTAVFGSDVVVPNMLQAYMIRPRAFGAPPKVVRDAAARREPGVVDVVTTTRGVAVLAERAWQARRAAALVEVEWGPSPLAGVDSDAVMEIARVATRGDGKPSHRVGNVGRTLERDDVTVVDVTYEAPYLAHAAMEPLNCTVHVRDGEVEVWAPTQSPTIVQRVAATICGLSPEKVTVHVTLLGGGFGRKAAPDFIADAVTVAQKAGRPVGLMWTREDDMRGGYYRPFAIVAMQGGVDRAGRPVAWRGHTVSQPITTDALHMFGAALPPMVSQRKSRTVIGSAVAMFRTGVLPEFVGLEGATKVPYAIENQSVEFTPVQTPIPVSFWRSVGHSYNGFVVESFIDELAHAAGRDPFEYRREHMNEPRLLACLEAAATHSGWGTPLEPGYARGIAAHESFGTFVAQVVEAGVIDGRIDVRRVTCVVDCGLVVNPDIVSMNMEGGIVFGLSAALMQKITFKDGEIEQGNFDDYPMVRMHESPAIDVHIIPSAEPPSGVGEPGTPPIAPAVANAIFAATGIRLRRMPFHDALAEALEGR